MSALQLGQSMPHLVFREFQRIIEVVGATAFSCAGS
jgi:hypothetical protein